MTIYLPAGRGYSVPACLALADHDPAMRVLRREGRTRIVRDTVLDGSAAPRARWLGHWLIRLAALHGGIGYTTALILDGELSPELAPCAAMLARDGAWIQYGPRPPGDAGFPIEPDRRVVARPIRPSPISPDSAAGRHRCP